MITKIDKNQERLKRHKRVRAKIYGTAETPRISVYRSLNHIYAQIIDDDAGKTLVACSTMEKSVAAVVEGKNKVETGKLVGMELGKRAKEKGIECAVFDRGGYLYTGRVKALADGARESGLKF